MFIGLLVLLMADRVKKIVIDVVVAVSAVVIAVGVSLVSSSSVGVMTAIVLASTIGLVVEKWK